MIFNMAQANEWWLSSNLRDATTHVLEDWSDPCGNMELSTTFETSFDLRPGFLPNTGFSPHHALTGVSKLTGTRIEESQDPTDRELRRTTEHKWSLTWTEAARRASRPVMEAAYRGSPGKPVNARTTWRTPFTNGHTPIRSYKVQAQKLNARGGVVRRITSTRAA